MSFAQLTNNISNEKTKLFLGSICCLVESTLNSNIKGILTSGHIFTNGEFIDFDGFVSSDQAFEAISNGDVIGELYFQQMIANQDLAIVRLNDPAYLNSTIKKFPGGFYPISQADLNSPTKNITILSKNNKQRDAFVVGLNLSVDIEYGTEEKTMRNVILIGSNANQDESTTVSEQGDSGSCVYHKSSGKMIGMLVGGDDQFSFVLPFEQTLSDNNFKLI